MVAGIAAQVDLPITVKIRTGKPGRLCIADVRCAYQSSRVCQSSPTNSLRSRLVYTSTSASCVHPALRHALKLCQLNMPRLLHTVRTSGCGVEECSRGCLHCYDKTSGGLSATNLAFLHHSLSRCLCQAVPGSSCSFSIISHSHRTGAFHWQWQLACTQTAEGHPINACLSCLVLMCLQASLRRS